MEIGNTFLPLSHIYFRGVRFLFMKRFLQWIRIKQRLDDGEHLPPWVSEGDLWWCSVGENVGIEAGGKSSTFTRPVVILKKFSPLGFLCVPLTTKQRHGIWYVQFIYNSIHQVAMLNQTRTISYKRLDRKMGMLDETDFTKIKEAFVRLFY